MAKNGINKEYAVEKMDILKSLVEGETARVMEPIITAAVHKGFQPFYDKQQALERRVNTSMLLSIIAISGLICLSILFYIKFSESKSLPIEVVQSK